MYILKLIGRYDEHIQVKERLIAERKKELARTYDSLINSMDDLLGKAAESSATMAERSFESKRRDFQRFLERAETRYTQIAGTKIDTDMMLQQFRRFVQRWLAVFEECSVDPISAPKRVVTEEELNRCRTVGDVASLTLERLKQTEVRFISSQRDKDIKVLQGIRAQQRRISAQNALTDGGAPTATPPMEIELQASPSAHWMPSSSSSIRKSLKKEPVKDMHRPSSASFGGRQVTQVRQGVLGCPCTWCQPGAFGFSYQWHSGDLGYPRIFNCFCFRLKLLSRAHAWLMCGFVCSFFIFFLEGRHVIFIGDGLFIFCLIVVLLRFEQIDIIQRLEREVEELAQDQKRITERKEQMVTFWNSMQQLTDLWVHRTVPRLDLLAEVQGHLQDAPPEDVLALMAGANARLEELENSLPELSLWRHSDNATATELTEESKKAFASRIEGLCQEEKLPKILHGINKVIEDQVLRIEGSGAQNYRVESY
jgi:hypothetical protein